jgi:SNF2 family DNA or RNA helicase
MPATRLRGPHLIVAPLSLVKQWEGEFAAWAPQINIVVFHGPADARDAILQHEFYFQEPFVDRIQAAALKKDGQYKFDVVLTTYEMAMKEVKIFSRINWEVLIVDEAHRLKNATSKVFEALRAIPRKHCVLLTGTPLQNKTDELWALLNFVDKKKFPDRAEFMQQFGDLRDAGDVAQLHMVLKPFLLRRIKEDVEKSLPPKEETIVEVILKVFLHADMLSSL